MHVRSFLAPVLPVFLLIVSTVALSADRGDEVKGLGVQASDLLFANLSKEASLWLVDREDLRATLSEQELNMSGVVNPQQAVKLGQITGAKIILTGSVFQTGNSLYLVAKVIGTETTRVLGVSAKGAVADGIDAIAKTAAADIAKTIKENSSQLVAEEITNSDRIKALKQKLGDAKLPAVLITITEQHLVPISLQGEIRRPIDPAAETEMLKFCTEAGFPVIDSHAGLKNQAQFLIQGEAISEFATRRGNLISAKARLEVKVIDRATGKIVATDRQTSVAVDLADQIAEKSALQEASAEIAERLLPKLVNTN
jgi:TolB-like protein